MISMTRAKFNARRPVAQAVCDSCGLRYSRTDLSWQYEWQGSTLQNQRTLVCQQCNDEPNPQLRIFIPPPDPMPVAYPRPDTANMGSAYTLTTVANVSTQIAAADANRSQISFLIPLGVGMWINAVGGVASPAGTDCSFYPAGSAFNVDDAAAQLGINYYCSLAGQTFTVETG